MHMSDQITVKLIDNATTIFVNGKEFKQCKYLLITLPKSKANGDFESIDEIADIYSNDNEKAKTIDIPPETEFWGHCSNLQAWVDHDYDTRLLKSDLSFPLLRELAKKDPKAMAKLKDEVCYRLESGYESVVLFLLEQGYLEVFDKDEFLQLFKQIKKNIQVKYTYLFIPQLYKHDIDLCLFLILGLAVRATAAARDAAYAARDAAYAAAARDAAYAARDAAYAADAYAADATWDVADAWNAARDVARTTSRKALRTMIKAIKITLSER